MRATVPRGGWAVRAFRVAAVLFAVAIAVWLVRGLVTDWQRLGQAELRRTLHLDPRPLLVAWVLQSVGWWIMVVTWRRMLGAEGERVPTLRHLRISAYTNLAHVLPGSVWAPASRLALYRQAGVSTLTVSAALLVEWLLVGVAGLLLFALVAPWLHVAPATTMAPLTLLAALALALLHPRVFGRLMAVAARRIEGDGADVPPAPRPRALARWFTSELLVLCLSGVALDLVMRAVGPRGSLPDAVGAWGIAMAVANLLFWLPASSIGKEVGVVLILTPVYASTVLALGVLVAWRLWMILVQLSWVAVVAAMSWWADRSRSGSDGRLPPSDHAETASTGSSGAPPGDGS